MVDIETAIRAWRRGMGNRKAILPEDLDELERHIRDHVAELAAQGVPMQDAWDQAVQGIAADPGTEEAYRAVYWGKLRRKGLIRTSISAELAMVRSQVQIAVRALKPNPGYTFLNVAGLAVGIACCLLILLFVREEWSFDQHHQHAERIVRVTLKVPDGRELEVTPTAVAPVMIRSFPQVESAVRLYDIGRFRKVTVRYGDKSWQESRFMYADSTVFDVLTLPFVEGGSEDALVRPGTVVLTRQTAQRYFGRDSGVLGELLQIGGGGDFEVTGVLEDPPRTSHVQFDLLASFASTSWADREIWDSANFYTYLLLTSTAALPALENAAANLLPEAWSGEQVSLGYQWLTDIYLVHQGRQRYVWIFAALALLILFAACINYVNLSTARSVRRAMEVGVRKALGAHRGQIIRQFFGESGLMTAVALVFGVGLALLLLPAFNRLGGQGLRPDAFLDPAVILLLLGLLVATALGAGLYPALLLSRFRPAVVLKGLRGLAGSGGRLRKALVVGQFAVTVFLLVGTWAVMTQLDLIRSGDLGFDRDHVAVVPLADAAAVRALPALKAHLASNPRVLSMAASNAIPGNQRGGYSLFLESGAGFGEAPSVSATPVDADIVSALGLDLLAGPGFSAPTNPLARPDSARYEYVVNEDLVRLAGWTVETAVGQRMSVSGSRRMGDVVGVIRNYNFLPLQEAMRPLALFVEPSWNVLLVKIDGLEVPSTLATIRAAWDESTGGSPFHYAFLDQEYNAFYQSEERLAGILGSAANLAILIACLGLFGLASYTAEQRTREIGIRKAMGASVYGLVAMLNREFSLLVLAGFAVGAPVAWMVMERWLQGYAFRAGMSVQAVLGTGALILVLAWGTAGWQSWRAARASPAEALGRS